MNTYELTYIINSVLNENQTKEAVNRVNNLIKDVGGEIVDHEEWGSRRLAYTIRKRRNGYYVHLVFRAPGDSIARLERNLQLDDDLLRYLTLRMDAKMLRHYEAKKQGLAAKAKARAAAEAEDDEDDE